MYEFEHTTPDEKLTVKMTAANDKEAFRKFSKFNEIYSDVPEAYVDGKYVSGGDTVFVVRKSKYIDEKGKEKEAEYFERRCINGPLAGYVKRYGVLDDGTDNLFPKRDQLEGHIHGMNGWQKYNGPKAQS